MTNHDAHRGFEDTLDVIASEYGFSVDRGDQGWWLGRPGTSKRAYVFYGARHGVYRLRIKTGDWQYAVALGRQPDYASRLAYAMPGLVRLMG